MPLVEAFCAQAPLDGDAHQEHHAGGAEMALPAKAILAVWVDDGMGGRKGLAHLVMVGDDDIHAAPRRGLQGLELVEPQSAVTIRRAPSSMSAAIAAAFGP